MKTFLALLLFAAGCLPAFAEPVTGDPLRAERTVSTPTDPFVSGADEVAVLKLRIDKLEKVLAVRAATCPVTGGTECSGGCTCQTGVFCTCATIDSVAKAQAAANRTRLTYQTYDGGRTWEPERARVLYDAPPVQFYQSAPQMQAIYSGYQQSGGGRCSGGSCR